METYIICDYREINHKKDRAVNKNCIIRLSHYRNALLRLQEQGCVKTFSGNLGNAVNVPSTQVRKDFSVFGITGNKRGGYQVNALLAKLDVILGKNVVNNVVLVGAGKVGSALMTYRGFKQGGMRLVAAFDVDIASVQLPAGIPVLPLEQFEEFIHEHDIRVMILAVPAEEAQKVAELALQAGIKGILNFAPVNLRNMDAMVINNVNLALELENVLYFVNADDCTQASC